MTLRTADITFIPSKALRIQLGEGELLNVSPDHGVSIEVREGKLWITRERDPKDYIVGPGETFHTDDRGHVVVEALGSTSLVMQS